MDLGTPAATKITGSLVLLVVVALGWTVVVGPETGALSAAREEVISIRDQNTLLAGQLAALERQRESLAKTRKAARDIAVKFPPTADQPGLFEEVAAAAVGSGIGAEGVTNLAPTPPVVGGGTAGAPAPAGTPPGAAAPGAGLARQAVTVAVTGTYDQTEQLLANLENMPRAYLVTDVSLAGDTEGGVYTTTITGDMFVMPPIPDPGKIRNLSNTTQPEG